MSIGIFSRPIKSGCNWNALGNPVIFKLQRQDHAFDQIQDNGGFVRLRINGTDVTAYYQVGNTVYYDGAIFATSATITASSFSGGHTLITVNVVYISTDAGIINNLSKRTDYRIEYNFKSVAGVELLGSDLSTSPGSDGIMLLNASLLKNLLSATWTLPVGINEADTDGSIEFYLSYQEYYDGALQGSVTNDSSNHIFGLLGANQIGSANGSNMLAYFPADNTKKWLTRFHLNSRLTGLKMWRDWPFTLSFIYPSSISGLNIKITEFDESGAQIDASIDGISASFDDAVNRIWLSNSINASQTKSAEIKLLASTGSSFTALTLPSPGSFTFGWNNDDSGTDWSLGAVAQLTNMTLGESSKILSTSPTPTVNPLGKVFRVIFDLTVPNTKSITINFYGFDGNWDFIGTLAAVGTGSSQSKTVNSGVIGSSTAFTKYGIRIVSNDNTAGSIQVDNFQIEYAEADQLLETISIEVSDACDYDEDNLLIAGQNPIMLQWKNSLGGDAQWLFPFYHEASYNLKGRKAKRLILFDQDLSAVQWEALQELISTNEVYSPPIIDLENTNTINSTSKQVGKQVYMIDQDGNKTGVIVIPNSDRINARDPHHRIAIEIELPEFQEV